MTAKGVTQCKDDVVELVVIPKVVHNNAEKVKDVVVGLLSVKRDCDLPFSISDGADDYLVVLRKFVHYPATRRVVRSRYQLLYPRVLKA